MSDFDVNDDFEPCEDVIVLIEGGWHTNAWNVKDEAEAFRALRRCRPNNGVLIRGTVVARRMEGDFQALEESVAINDGYGDQPVTGMRHAAFTACQEAINEELEALEEALRRSGEED